MSNLFIFPHDEKSNGARDLSKALGVRRILLHNSTFKGDKSKTVINWGASTYGKEITACNVINRAKFVERSADKLLFFRMNEELKGGRTPWFTTSKDKVLEWIRDGRVVVARTKTKAKAGAGIVFFDSVKEFCSAPLYTVYIRKKEEYRVHFAFGQVIDVQQKVLRKIDDHGKPINPKLVDWRIRNHRNGFIFIRNALHTPPDVIDQALKCAKASSLDFGAVDVVWNETQQKAYILEINTAPGIEGTTIENYARAIRENVK